MEKVKVSKKDEVYIKIDCDRGLAQEISIYFTFDVPGAKFMPSVRNKYWDGKIRLFNTQTMLLYTGLLEHLRRFCEERDYEFIVGDNLDCVNDISIQEAKEIFSNLPLEPRDYQLGAFVHAVRKNRALILSPTASGKSLIIYMLCRYYKGRKLVIVPTTSLVHQMSSDFEDYYSSNQQIYSTAKIMASQEKNNEKEIIFSTWQSIYKQPKKWFDAFDVIIGDEAHLFKAQSLTSIMTKLTDCRYRFGFTGTLDDTETNKLVLEGLFGPVMKVVTTQELIENKTLSPFRIKGLVLKYPPEVCKPMNKATYQDEIKFLISNEKRNIFIKNLTLSRKGNTLVLYQMVEKHGAILYDMINKGAEEGRKVFFIHGGIDADERESVRSITEKEDNAIIIASYGTFSTGINIKRLHNIIFASPTKSRVRTLQSIGRGLRKGEGKEQATLYDIADNISWKSWNNHTLKHFAVRVKMYNEEQFEYKIYNIKVKDD